MCAQGIYSVSTKYSGQEYANACRLSLPVNKDILRYEGTQNRGVTGKLQAKATANFSIEILHLSNVCVKLSLHYVRSPQYTSM
jgi:hypothetical protein